MSKFSTKSLQYLETCNKQLQDLLHEVVKYQDCKILSGHRGEEEQNELFERGMSKARYPNSNHNTYPSSAVDVMSYPVERLSLLGLLRKLQNIKNHLRELP